MAPQAPQALIRSSKSVYISPREGQAENERMTEALSRQRDEACTESLARQFAEKKCKQLEEDVGDARIVGQAPGSRVKWLVS